MKKAKKLFALAMAVIMAVSCFGVGTLAAPGDGAGGGNGEGGNGGGGGNGGPPQVYLTVELTDGAQFTYGDVTLTLSGTEGAGFALSQGEKTITCTSQYEELTEGQWPGVKGIAHLSQLTVTGADDADALAAMMPKYWSADQTLILNQDGTFAPTIDVNGAAVAYTADSVKNDASATGYTTTISVSDPDKSYSSMLAYGKWMCSDVTDTEAVAYEPEEWKNGYYYSAYGIRAMSYDEVSKAWTLSLDLASANMAVACYADVDENMLSDVDDPQTSVMIPYDSEKQSQSFDWSNTAPCAQTGTLTTVQVNEEIKLRVYTPYGYNAADTTTRYPVVYLIAGMQASFDSWLDGGGNANVVFDNLIASGEVAPTILVAMERDVARMDCYDVWDSADDRAKSNGDGDGYINYVDGAAKGSDVANMIRSDVVTTVVPYIDANYNTAADAEHRAVIGCSMGGVAASQIWLTDYEMFNFYGFFSGSDMWFKEANDEEADPEYMALRDTYEAAYTTLLNDVAANMDGVKILVGGGITDRNTFGGDQNSSGSDNISAWLTEAGIDHGYSVVGGEHDWASWTQLLDQFAGYLAEEGSTWQVTEQKEEAPAQTETPTVPETPAQSTSDTYVVVAGDCLWSIAAKTLGNGNQWGVIYEANKAVIKTPELIYVGQTLVIPG